MEQESKEYEISFLLRDRGGVERILGALTQTGAEILLEGPVDHLTLAYPISREQSADFGYIHFRGARAAVDRIRESLERESLVLRFLIITPPFVKARPRWEGRTKTTPPVSPEIPAPRPPASTLPLTNEALEKQIEEILK